LPGKNGDLNAADRVGGRGGGGGGGEESSITSRRLRVEQKSRRRCDVSRGAD